MSRILVIVAPVFGVILLGYALGKLRLVNDKAMYFLSAVVFKALLPLMLFEKMLKVGFPADVDWSYLAVYFGAGTVMFVCGACYARFGFGLAPDSQGIFGFASSYSNTWLIGLPLVLSAYGEAATVPLFMLLGVNALIMLPGLTVVLESCTGNLTTVGGAAWRSFRGACSNPIVIGLTAGFIGGALELRLPPPLDVAGEWVGHITIPCALLVMGLTISRFRAAAYLREAAGLGLFKIIGHPLLTWVVGKYVLQLEPLWLAIAVIVAAAPPGINVFLFSHYYRVSTPAIITTVVTATLCSMLTLPLVLWIVGV